MVVTLNEVERTCQKALSGWGAPAGVDEDAAAAAAWLEVRGLPALAALVDALERWPDPGTALNLSEGPAGGTGWRFAVGGRSAVFLAGALVDLAVAGAALDGHAELRVEALGDPRFLVPLAAQRGRAGGHLALLWSKPGADLLGGARIEGPDGTSLLGDWAGDAWSGAVDVTLTCGRRKGGGAVLPVALGESELEQRRRSSLAGGIDVDDGLWRRLSRHAARALVPASPESRARGAGSLASDNE